MSHACGWQEREPLTVDEVGVGRHAGNQQADEVGLLQRLGHVVGHDIEVAARRHRRRGALPPAPDHAHLVASPGDPGHRLTDTAGADDGQRLAPQFDAELRRPLAVAHRAGDRRQPPGRSGDEEERQFGHRLIEHGWGVRAEEAGRRRLTLVDPLVAHAETRDHAPPRQRRVERLAIRLPADDDVAGTGVGDGVDQGRFLGGRRHKGEARATR